MTLKNTGGGQMAKGKRLSRPEEVRDRLKELIQKTLQEALEAELEDFLGYPRHQRTDNPNSRNGYTSKDVKTEIGEVELHVPRDRKSGFEPQIVKKRQRVLGEKTR